MKKILLLVLVSLLLVSVLAPTAYASDKVEKDVAQYDQIGKHKLEVIDEDDLPDGIVPMKFNSREEAELYLNHLEQERIKINTESALAAKKSAMSNTSSAIVPMAAAATTYYNGSGYKDHNFSGGLHYVRVRCYYTYYYHPTTGTKLYKSCNNVSSTNNGYTLDTSWEQNGYSATVYSRYISVRTYGTMRFYLLINGVLQLWSEEYSFYDEF